MLNFGKWLTEGQTDSPEFQAWFHGSTLVNPDGTPMVLFHGTKARPFQKFEYRKGKRYILFSEFEADARGFFFTEHPAHAKSYGPNVVACYVRLARPFVDPRVDKHLGVDRLPYQRELHLGKLVAPMIQRHPQHGHFIDIGVAQYWLNPQRDEFPMQWAYHGLDGNGLVWDVLDCPGSVERLKRLGYDGTWVSEPNDDSGRSVFVPDADQIRMVEWNKFDQWKRDYPLEYEDDEEKYDWRIKSDDDDRDPWDDR